MSWSEITIGILKFGMQPLGEHLQCQQDVRNEYDLWAVAVLKPGLVLGHVPRKISSVHCLRCGGVIQCTVTGTTVNSPNNGHVGT